MDESYYRSLEPFWGSWHIVGKQKGEGAYGKIFEIEREDFGRKYTAALKVMTVPRSESEWENIRSEGMTEEATREYFHDIVAEIIDETILMSELRGHSNIVSYEDHMVIEHADRRGWDILIRMELLSPLVPAIKDRIVDRATVLKIGIDICKALEVCQKSRIIHRDIKPDNILFNGNGDYKLGDFGVAKIMEQGKDATTAKQGTINYMAPEVWRSLPYNSTADIYSLGAVLYQLANRNRCILFPLEGTLTYQIKENATNRRMMGESFSYPVDAQDELGQVILKACAYLPADRYQTATEFRMALERVQANQKQESMSALSVSVPTELPQTEVVKKPISENAVLPGKIKPKNVLREKRIWITVAILFICIIGFLVISRILRNVNLKEDVDSKGHTTMDFISENTESDNVLESKIQTAEKQDVSMEDFLLFGHYEQDGDIVNGPESIEWVILEEDDDRYLLISRYILDAQPYNITAEPITWEKCSLRYWLNNDFYKTAFSSDEREKILSVTVYNPNNEQSGIYGGYNTQDKLFCLSMDEILKYYKINIWNDRHGWGYSQSLMAENTAYAVEQGAKNYTIGVISGERYDRFVSSGYDENYCFFVGGKWWLRTPGESEKEACVVGNDGKISFKASDGWVSVKGYGVRPALYLAK